MKILVVCAHLMDQTGCLNAESKGRCKVASELFRKLKYNKIIVPGWSYRDDSQVTISSSMKDYLVDECDLNPSLIVEEPRARDTVGDAVFCRMSVKEYLDQITSLTIVTSEYHVSRAIKIFKFVFGEDIFVNSYESFGMEWRPSFESSELASLKAFENTFSGITPGDITVIVERLLSSHPFYNGECQPKLTASDCI